MALKRHINSVARYILSPQFGDFFIRESNEQALACMDIFEVLLQEIDGLSFDTALFGDFPSAGQVSIRVSDLMDLDVAYIARHNPMPELWLDSVVLLFEANWANPQAVADANRANGTGFRRQQVQTTCGNFLDEIAKKFLVLL